MKRRFIRNSAKTVSLASSFGILCVRFEVLVTDCGCHIVWHRVTNVSEKILPTSQRCQCECRRF